MELKKGDSLYKNIFSLSTRRDSPQPNTDVNMFAQLQ